MTQCVYFFNRKNINKLPAPITNAATKETQVQHDGNKMGGKFFQNCWSYLLNIGFG